MAYPEPGRRGRPGRDRPGLPGAARGPHRPGQPSHPGPPQRFPRPGLPGAGRPGVGLHGGPDRQDPALRGLGAALGRGAYGPARPRRASVTCGVPGTCDRRTVPRAQVAMRPCSP
ncbi:Exonuclease SbcC [Actinacidiphila bryophytorum]|uniref:Exonuclease SbcC n=1 Tax=Actinacidiphila bryophytorum TaxID=1436133 RepID=A0A9W4H3N0_9ACTN|nr:Exonuclease SbcC [Actinacidiphila bryophytorum]